MMKFLPRRPAAIDAKAGAGHHGGARRGQIEDRGGDVFDRRQTPGGDIAEHGVAEFLVLEHGPGHGRIDEGGGDRVDADAALGMLHRHCLGHQADRALGGVIAGVNVGLTDHPGDGRDVHDGAAAGFLHLGYGVFHA